MLKNYLKVALRSLWQQKAYSFINIFGLAVGLASTILIVLWVNHELSYDRFHDKEDRLYQAWNRGVFDGELHCWYTTPSLLGPVLKKDYPEIVETSRMNWTNRRLLRYQEKTFHVKGTEVDPDFLTMFSFPLLQGDAETALDDIQSIVITQSLARKLFGKKNPMNKVIRYEDKDNFVVKGVIADLPDNTAFDFEFLLPWEYLKKEGGDYAHWGNNSYMNYVALKPEANLASVNRKIREVTILNSNKEEDTEVFLHSIKNWRLYSTFENGKIAGGRIEYVRLFSVIAGFILLIACINFMNLATARSEKRVKEVGIRKTVGAKRETLITQFLGEAMLVSFFALALAIVLAELALPFFNTLTEKQLYIDYANPTYWLAGLGFVIFTGLLAGSYPAFYLSSFEPTKVLKGTYRAARAAINPRRVLVVLQFTFSIALIISTIIVYQQIQFAKNRSQGYDKEQLVFHYLTGDLDKNLELIRKELKEQRVATSVCKTNHPITSANSNTWGVEWPGKDLNAKIIFDQMTSDQNFAQTMGIEMVAGRDIDLHTYKTDTTACIMNETAIKVMRMEDPIGKSIKYGDKDYRIVGVFKDFIWGSPYEPIRPLFVRGEADWYNVVTLRLDGTQSTSENLKKAEAIFKKYNPYYPVDFRFVDQEYAKKFKNEQLIGTLANAFALLTIIISCLGLFGLAAYTAELKTKEIGIRKVLGARVFGIVMLLSKDFLRLVMIAFVIASPLTWWLMQQWLEDYKYRITISWWVFALSGLMALLIAVCTVSYQAIRASRTNPVSALRYE